MKEKRSTMSDIAKIVGVSKATVSMVINKKDQNISEETRKEILETAQKIGYVPNLAARTLNTKVSGTIGIIVPDITNPFFSQISRAVEDIANKSEYSVILCNSDNKIDKELMYVKLLVSKQVDGVLLMSGGNDMQPIEILKQNGIPFVLVDRYIEGYNDEIGVYCDSRQGIAEAVKYLYEKGKRNIAFVCERSKIYVFRQRLNAYIQVMMDYGIFKNNVFESTLSLRGGMEATEEIIKSARNIDAVLYCSDIMAMGGMKAFARNKIAVPDNMGVVGFDNIQIAEYMEPGLTTVAQPIYEMGKTACEILIDYLKRKDSKKFIVFKSHLIIRDSV